VKCEVCDKYEATVKDYRDDGEKYRSCHWCANLSARNWHYMMHHKTRCLHHRVDPKTFYEEDNDG
jgi:hypothetical protein